jgi:hypothetical protein
MAFINYDLNVGKKVKLLYKFFVENGHYEEETIVTLVKHCGFGKYDFKDEENNIRTGLEDSKFKFVED